MNLRSGRLMLELIEEYKRKGEPFGFETTLAGKRWFRMIRELKLAGYKVPRMVEFRKSLPQSAVGKVLRRMLRAEEIQKSTNKKMEV